MSLTSTDQQVWRKVLAAKNRAMTQQSLEAAFPGMPKKSVQTSLATLLQLNLLTTSTPDGGTTVFHGQTATDAKKKQTLTQEQSLILSLVSQAGNRGIGLKVLRNHIGTDTMPMATMRKTLDSLEKSEHIKQFKAISAPTVSLWILASVKPADDLQGGIWYDQSKEYDAEFVDAITKFLLLKVRAATFPKREMRTKEQNTLVPHPIHPIARTPKLPTPHSLLRALKGSNITQAPLHVKNVMEVMRALELDGEVEAIKPAGGVEFEADSEDEGPSAKKRKKSDSDVETDDEEREKQKEKEREKAKAKAKEKKRREKEKEKSRKEKEREKKRREKEKEKEKKRKKKKKAKEKDKKRKRSKGDSEPEDDDDDEPLRDINDLSDDASAVGKKKSSKSKSKSKRRHSPSSASDTPLSSSSDDSDSDSDDSDDSDSDSDVSSVDSDDLDSAHVPFRPEKSAMMLLEQLQDLAFAKTDLTDLTDTHVVYRATKRYSVDLGQTQAPCGKCPQFTFCQEDGPVNPDSCLYFGDWLGDIVGGWDAEAKKKYKPIPEEPVDMDDGESGEMGNGIEDEELQEA